jgi:hypothetical protein
MDLAVFKNGFRENVISIVPVCEVFRKKKYDNMLS